MNRLKLAAFPLATIIILTGCVNKVDPAKNNTPIAQREGVTCINEFKALQRLSPSDFAVYQAQFTQLTNAYDVYRTNGGTINKDSQEILNIELQSKLKMICARVKGAVFKNMDERSQEINKI
ncbi:hypothetical protein [Rahnella laticis]|uniref:hypothetical protein n=1 Tax=Rahnella laticis TaxID=2787622 RepID=UPI001E308BB0|nr:hypothetical protein [Rahnella laticis]